MVYWCVCVCLRQTSHRNKGVNSFSKQLKSERNNQVFLFQGKLLPTSGCQWLPNHGVWKCASLAMTFT